jgi:glycosyltransferase involved in cell wall biosynthesis
MAACHVLVSASEAEGRSNAVLEGLAAGRVCVASDASGVSDLARQLPQLYEFRTGDVDALTGCLQRLLDHWPAEAQGAEQQRETVRRLIPDWDHCAGRYLDLLRSLPDAH